MGVGWWAFVAAHFVVLAFLRDWRPIAAALVFWPFWNDVLWGGVMTFVLVAAWCSVVQRSRISSWVLFAMGVLMPRPLMLPVIAWLLWKRPESRLPFAVIFLAHVALVLASGLGGEWLARLFGTPSGEMIHEANFAPSRWIGWAWVPVGLTLAAWLTWKGRLGLASIAAQPYPFPYYMLMVLLELRPQSNGSKAERARA